MPRLWDTPPEIVGALTGQKALMDELVLFPQGEHNDLFDGLQIMVEGTTSYATVIAERYAPIPRWKAVTRSFIVWATDWRYNADDPRLRHPRRNVTPLQSAWFRAVCCYTETR